MKKVNIVVWNFPIPSETFILRLLEGVSENPSIKINIVVLNEYSPGSLKTFSPKLFELILSGAVGISSNCSEKRYPLRKFTKYLRCVPLIINSPLTVTRLLIKEQLRLKTLLKGLLFCNLIKEQPTDIIHAQFLNIAVYSALLREFRSEFENVAYISSIRGADISSSEAITPNELAYLSKADFRYMSVSRSLKNYAVNRGLARDAISILHSGLDTSRIPFTLPSEKLLFSSGKHKFLQVGRLVEKKGFHLSLHVLHFLAQKKYDFEFHVVGDGPLLESLRKLAATLNIDGNVFFHGALHNDSVISHMQEASFLLVPSVTGPDGDMEGIPNIAKEGMLCGCMVVGSNHSGIPEVIIDSKTGFLFEEGNVDEYLNAIERAILSYECWDDIAIAARSKIHDEFEIKVLSDKLYKTYTDAT